jgi:hypothetical protein
MFFNEKHPASFFVSWGQDTRLPEARKAAVKPRSSQKL